MRQIVASYFIYDLEQDWRIGAAYFEYQLVDYDVSSNWGNALSIGTGIREAMTSAGCFADIFQTLPACEGGILM